MNREHRLSDKWIKASITGTLWAASEIVLGSFLHNLKIPFSGSVLTAIGIIILVSVSYIWKDKGLFWRAGLICAMMKTMSPSAVIFGPMIAIFSEAALMEISVRILGRTVAGYISGAMLAMSWNLFQKIANFIIFYGFNIVGLYTNLINFAQKQLNIQSDIKWLLPAVLLVLYCIFGLISAIAGIRIGRKLLLQPASYQSPAGNNNFLINQGRNETEFNYSIAWLVVDIIFIIGSLALLNYTGWYIWVTTIVCIVTFWALRYKRALRQLSKPKFWIFFVLITMLTAFVFTRVATDSGSLAQGLLLGLQMNFRAVIIIVGFSVLGTELYSPVIRKFFMRTYFKQLPLALELSFDSLPAMIANIPEFKTIIRNPVQVFYQIISQISFRLEEQKRKIEFNRKVFILSGGPGKGKTTEVKKVIEVLRADKISVGGIYSPKIRENDTTTGYDVFDIVKDESEVFLRAGGEVGFSKIGRFNICPRGLQKGLDALKSPAANMIVIIDETGLLELEDQGWAGPIKELLDASINHLLLVVRDIYVEKVIEKWNLKDAMVFDITRDDYLTISNSILLHIK